MTSTGLSSVLSPTVDWESLRAYLEQLIPIMLGAESRDLDLSLFSFPDALDLCRRFTSDSSMMVLYVIKEREEERSDESDEVRVHYVYSFREDLIYVPSLAMSLALIKRAPVLEAGRPLASQLQMMTLPGPASSDSSKEGGSGPGSTVAGIASTSMTPDVAGATDSAGPSPTTTLTSPSTSPYEALHAYIHHAVSPYFSAFASAKSKQEALAAAVAQSSAPGGPTGPGSLKRGAPGGPSGAPSDDKDGKMGIPMAKKKFAELELSLLHLQQNVEIPEIILSIHPAIQRAVEKCRESNKRVTVDAVDASLLGDSSFLNRLQGDVNGWIKEIQKVTKLTRDPASGQAIQEINFWLSMERALERIEEQLKSDPIVLTLDVLKHAKRFHATVSFRADTGLKEGSERVYRYNQLMKDFPLNELLSATDVGKCRDALILIFGHLNKKLKLSPYPIRRALPLVEAISRDLNDQLLKVLGSRRIMFMEYGDFERAMSGAEEVFRTWDELVKEFTNVAREVTRKRSEKFIPIKINAAHAKLQERMSFVRAFRRQHEQLYQTIVRVMSSAGQDKKSAAMKELTDGKEATTDSATDVTIVQEEVDAVEEVSLAYQLVRGVDVLDVGGEGTEAWVAAETGYNERVARVENLMISRLRDRLGTARNANEMFRVFGTFNALFVRPKIRGAIQEYQTQLIETVKADIKGLHDTFKRGYRHSEAHPASQLRDTPPISGSISWARQIERQLSAYMGRVEAVLGRGWELYAEGAKLAAESASFRRKLDARPMYDSWLAEITKRDLSVRGLIFAVSRVRLTRDDKRRYLILGHGVGPGGPKDPSGTEEDEEDSPEGEEGVEYVLELGVNFDTQVITLFKEVRRLLWLGFQVPHGIANVAKDAKRVYPFAVSLMETVRTYSQTLVRLRAYDAVMASGGVGYIPGRVTMAQATGTSSKTPALPQMAPGKKKMGPLLPLMAGQQAEVQGMLEKGMGLRWDYFVNTFDTHHRSLAYTYGVAVDARENRHVLFVREFAAIVSALQDKTDGLIALDEEVRGIVEGELRTGDYRASTFVDALGRIQKVVDKLSLEGYTNLEGWVEALDERIEEVLLERLEAALEVWIDVFVGMSRKRKVGEDEEEEEEEDDEDEEEDLEDEAEPDSDKRVWLDPEERRRKRKEAAKERKKRRGEKNLAPGMLLPSIRVLKHEVRIKHQVMYLDPPLERARSSWYSQLHAWLAIVGHLPRIHGGRYEGGMNVQGYDAQGKDTYGGLLTKLSKNKEVYSLHAAYSHMEAKLSEVSEYVGVWLQYQSLWDLEANYVFSELGEDLGRWQQILQEIRKARTTFDRSETDKDFGPLLVDYGQVQSKVGAKYDAWQREVLGRYGQLLGSGMRTFHVEVGAARTELEAYSVEASATREAVAFITFVQDLRKKVARWTELVELYRTGQKVLERQRYQFPSDWVYVDQVEGEWSAFQEILHRKNTAIQEQVAGLQMKIITEDRAVQERIRKIIGEWEEAKPVQGDLAPEMATATLATFEGRVTRLKADYDLVDRAKGALDLEGQEDGGAAGTAQAMAASSGEGARLTAVLEELRDLQGVWRALSEVWARIAEMRDTLWSVVVPRKLRQQLEGLLQQTKEMPNRTRQYAAHEFLTDRLRGWVRANALLTDMRSEALRDRHWRQLFKALRVNGGAGLVLSEMTLGQIWDLDLRKNEQTVREVVVQAQGELALEEFLRGVREVWTGYVLELVPYQGKCRLIRGWDDLFAKCAEHQSALAAMRMSPYYRVFEEEAGTWEGKLGRVYALFDVWIDVQRQWVYLEGIFTGSADIKHLLPVETARFQGIHGEFLGVMRRVYSSPFVLDVLGIPGVQKSMERLAEMLAKIQKALGEYLERERSSFPRFYFVGDEDLLEIIGNSKEVSRIQKHMRKMFAGLAGIILEGEETDDTRIVGMTSKEGEEVRFVRPISLSQYPKINEWLSRLEMEMRHTLAVQVGEAIQDLEGFYYPGVDNLAPERLLTWVASYPSQLVVLAVQAAWTSAVENALIKAEEGVGDGPLKDGALGLVERGLTLLADAVLTDLPVLQRRRCEHLITELVHQRDVIRQLVQRSCRSTKDFGWLYQMRFYYRAGPADPLDRLVIQMASASFPYGFEYLGVPDRLVQTPLTDRCYLTLTQALEGRLGGSPFGPAGTGKTESVKALGVQMGRFVLVFCCDDTFDFQAMGRIFVGLCRVGAWGCFDEFNRLEERILSAVSQQVQTIQEGLKATITDPSAEVELVGKRVKVHPSTGIYITMNPGYAGRSNLPDNLKKLFRSIAMTRPDRELIAQVMLYSQGFRGAEMLASKIVPLFHLCSEQLSPQSHYDFGLRALKSVLVSAGNLKREMLQEAIKSGEPSTSGSHSEQEILIQSVRETLVPKLVAEDIPLLQSLVADVFPGVEYVPVALAALREAIREEAAARNLVAGETWVEKVVQLYQIQTLHHGVMLVGPSGTGKSSAWTVLLAALDRVEGNSSTGGGGGEGVSYVVDPKAMSKEKLYGTLDATTREWTDGLFTHILRKIVDNVRGEGQKRHWIVFDGDVDPEWVENLNSVLDDNRILTLPNGERLSLPPNVRIFFEVETLRYATLATVSRCGMVWYSEDEVVTLPMMCAHYLGQLRSESVLTGGSGSGTDGKAGTGALMLDEAGDEATADAAVVLGKEGASNNEGGRVMRAQRAIADLLDPYFEKVVSSAPFVKGKDEKESDQASLGLIMTALQYAETQVQHIMEWTRGRAFTTLFSLLNKMVRAVIEYNVGHPDFPLEAGSDTLEIFVGRRLLLALVWAFSGDAKLTQRAALGRHLIRSGVVHSAGIEVPSGVMDSSESSSTSLLDFDLLLQSEANGAQAVWVPWEGKVPTVELETHAVSSADVVIPTVDTLRHEEVLYAWLAEHRPLLLCGPPGSGKTMTLLSALRKLPALEIVDLNFSSATTPELILRTLEQHGEYRRTPGGGCVLAPSSLGKWLVLFCDEINLPAQDRYGTQRVLSFLRQLIEAGGFWRSTDKAWVRLERVQFVGACNPPTDPGRVPLSARFLRHAPLLLVDYPGELSLKQIYGTLSKAMLKVHPALRGHSEALTGAMVELYLRSQTRFTTEAQAHYVYSPRELTRWMRGIHEAIRPLESLSLEGLVRVWAHEALRLFQDRLVSDEERDWTDSAVDEVAARHFPQLAGGVSEALARPILYSNWLSREYIPVEREELRAFAKARLRVFHEEELDVPLVLFNDVLDHVLRIDRVFRQVQGHLLLIGVSGSGKTTLSRFVAWMNGLSVFQIKAHRRYTGEDFDEDLRTVLRRAGCRGEKICFILDEGNVLDSGFLERMNTLLANAEVPGLFEGDEYATLMTQCKEASQKEGLLLDSGEELYKWFRGQVARNLHVVFTMNPPEGGLASRAATSPALFNRCVLDWFGDWSDQAFFQVGKEFTNVLDLDLPNWQAPHSLMVAYRDLPMPPSYRDAVVNAMVYVHQSLYDVNDRLAKRHGKSNYVTPRHFLDFIQHYVRLFREKREELEEQQRHLNVGLEKLRATVGQVEELRVSLAQKKSELEKKNSEANEKLRKMVADQQEAETKKSTSIRIQGELEVQKKAIEERRTVVMQDLANAEPAVAEAQQAVSGIKKAQLTEVRSMANPPLPVKLAMESVCTLLGHKIDSWRAVQQQIRRDDFISSIINFDTDRAMTRSLREKMKKEFLRNESFNFDVVNRASRACGPLVKWVTAQVNYSEILDRVGPLRAEVDSLEREAEATQQQAGGMETMISELEASIATYKDEYAMLISETQAIKQEMERVKGKVDRSLTLLASLSEEKERWEAGSQTFEVQMGTIVGDVLLSSAFMAYGGYFDQAYRELLVSSWTQHLVSSGIQFKQDLSLTEYLSTADDRLAWQEASLPSDDLCTENAIMLQRFNRYPLIIDPSGQATSFLLNKYQERKITVTSFLDDAFLKNLESALRFGNPLLIQDVEHLDPILNPVLNRELRRTGGRVLIRLGGQDIDFSPSFTLFLSTRDPSVSFPPDVCSRVTFVNFTVTRGSLQSQCLAQVLKAERPDIDQKRTDLLKLQGEFRLRLRHLEKSLLAALNASTGSILDDDHVISTLERLKKEAAEVAVKVAETETIMREVEETTRVYTPIASACSAIYFGMEQLSQLHHFYQFSLDFFYGIFRFVLGENPRLTGVSDPEDRLRILSADLFSVAFRRAAQALLHEDHPMFGLILAQIRLRGSGSVTHIPDAEYEFLLSGTAMVGKKDGTSGEGMGAEEQETSGDVEMLVQEFGIEEEEARKVQALEQKIGIFHGLVDRMIQDMASWKAFLRSSTPESEVPSSAWNPEKEAPEGTLCAFRTLLLIRCLRSDRLVSSVEAFVRRVFQQDNFLTQASTTELQLGELVDKEVASATPVALCSVPGHDASNRVEQLAAERKARCVSVALGSAEGFTLADGAITSAAKSGTWVLLKNVHLAPQWLGQLEKRLHALRPHASFRLFLTMETHPKVPVNLLRRARVLMFEPAPGVRAHLQQLLRGIPTARVTKAPAERARLYFLLAWLHAVVVERLRYAPLGWSKGYEFGEADHESALATIDRWLDTSTSGEEDGAAKTHISPEKIPWAAIRTLLTETVYGGRIDNEYDQRVLESFVGTLFTPKSYDYNFVLVKREEGSAEDTEEAPEDEEDGSSKRKISASIHKDLCIPDATRMEQFLGWVDALPDREPPTWLGLPADAERVILTARGQTLLSRARKMQSVASDDAGEGDTVAAAAGLAAGIEGMAGKEGGDGGSGAPSQQQQPAWMQALGSNVAQWLDLLPEVSTPPQVPQELLKDPLVRVFVREAQVGRSLLARVIGDLQEVGEVCAGTAPQTNHRRMLLSNLSRGLIPDHWRKFKVPRNRSLAQWIVDLGARLKQATDAEAKSLSGAGGASLEEGAVWLGGLFNPGAFITATRQAVAQRHAWSLEELTLRLDLIGAEDGEGLGHEEDRFAVSGLRLEGARWEGGKNGRLVLCAPGDGGFTRLGQCGIRWVKEADEGDASSGSKDHVSLLPVYLNGDREDLLFGVDIAIRSEDKAAVLQRGLAITTD